MGRPGSSIAILAQASLVYSSVHTAIDHPSSIIMSSHSRASKTATLKLTTEQHERAMLLGLDYLKATTKSKFVYIRDELAKIFKDHIIVMRLHPHQVGIHPNNRDHGDVTASGVWIRGARINESGFSFAAIGIPYAFEDHPTKRHIGHHTIDNTKGAEFGNFQLMTIKVGAANWTHSNQFCLMVEEGTVCSDPNIPCIDGRIDTQKILGEKANVRMRQYIDEGMYWNVFPSWVEETYPWMPSLFATAANQEQQVQEGESWEEVLTKIAIRASETLLSGKSMNANAISTHVLRSQPPNPKGVPPMVDWYMKWGGGENKHFVTDIAQFCKAMGCLGWSVYRAATSRN